MDICVQAVLHRRQDRWGKGRFQDRRGHRHRDEGFSSWVSTWKLGNVLKIGGAGGLIAVVYSTWRSGVSAIADATGMSEDTTATLIGLAFAGLVLYVIVRLILPPRDRSGVDVYMPERYDDWEWRGPR